MEDKIFNIRSHYPKHAKRLRIILVITSILLGIGLVTPIITMTKFILVENTFSILSGTIKLLKDGQVFLFLIIAGFSVILPILKIIALNKFLHRKILSEKKLERQLHWMHLYGKWSMLDVFVVAVLVVVVKLGAIASVEMQFGLYAFTAAVLLTMYVTAQVVKLTQLIKEQTL